MKADLYIQGHYWATIDIPSDSLLAMLAKGMITHAEAQAKLIHQELNLLDGIRCTISLRYKHTVAYEPEPTNQKTSSPYEKGPP